MCILIERILVFLAPYTISDSKRITRCSKTHLAHEICENVKSDQQFVHQQMITTYPIERPGSNIFNVKKNTHTQMTV
uniref:Putative secreted protein n=1 Tax=Anopheles triannulatus TaxID=58253 RepID=A0A2M4B1L0_9DIPT